MDKANLIGIHEAGVAHHVATISEIYRQHGATAILDGAGTVVVQLFVVVRGDISTWEHGFDVRQKLGVDRHNVLEVSVNWAILNHPNLAVALDDLRLDLADLLLNQD